MPFRFSAIKGTGENAMKDELTAIIGPLEKLHGTVVGQAEAATGDVADRLRKPPAASRKRSTR
jgi:hypothetical protein